MTFYESIVKYYEYIFPLKKQQVEFVLNAIQGTKDIKLLDIGCATGALDYELSQNNIEVCGIDLDEGMITLANEKYKNNQLSFLQLDMNKIDNQYDPHT